MSKLFNRNKDLKSKNKGLKLENSRNKATGEDITNILWKDKYILGLATAGNRITLDVWTKEVIVSEYQSCPMDNYHIANIELSKICSKLVEKDTYRYKPVEYGEEWFSYTILAGEDKDKEFKLYLLVYRKDTLTHATLYEQVPEFYGNSDWVLVERKANELVEKAVQFTMQWRIVAKELGRE
jgi:hypothetical protein